MEPAVVLLYGFPAAGKYTIAQALSKRLEEAGAVVRVIDNHYVNNVVFGVLDIDGIKPVTREVWRKVRAVRDIVFDTVRDLSPPDWTFIFTNHLVKDQDEWARDEVRSLASSRGARYVAARLECDVDALCERVDGRDRRARLKWADPVALRAHFGAVEMVNPAEDELVFDTGTTSATDVAAAIAQRLLS